MKSKGKAIVELFQSLQLRHPIQSVDELYNGISLCQLYSTFLDGQMLEVQQSDDATTYFVQLVGWLRGHFKQMDLPSEVNIDLTALTEEEDTHQLYRMVKYVFKALIQSDKFLEHVRKLPHGTQQSLMRLIRVCGQPDHECRISQYLAEIYQLEEKLTEVQKKLVQADTEIEELKNKQSQYEMRIEDKELELEPLRTIHTQYEEIRHENRELIRELEIANMKIEGLTNQNAVLEKMHKQVLQEYEKDCEVLNGKIEQTEVVNGKLRQSIKYLQDTEQQKGIQEKIMREMEETNRKLQSDLRQNEFLEQENRQLREQILILKNQLLTCSEEFENMKDQLNELNQQKEAYLNQLHESRETPRYLDATIKDKIQSDSKGQCDKKGCLAYKQQLQSMRSQYLQVVATMRTPSTNYLQQCHRIIDQKSKLIEEYRERMTKFRAENVKLKEKLMSNMHSHQYEQIIGKLREKNTVLKKKLEETRDQRQKDKASVMKMSQYKNMYIDLMNVVRQCPICQKLVR